MSLWSLLHTGYRHKVPLVLSHVEGWTCRKWRLLSKNWGGVYELPVRINGVLTLNFILNAGASQVNIMADQKSL